MTAKPVIVLVRPQLGQNIGKAARAMLNFGLTEIRLVAPRDGWPNPEAGPAASGADVVLEQARLFDTVEDAIADCDLVFASTVRRRDLVMPVVGPEPMADRIAASPGRSAILFGPERSGLETEEVALANAIVTVPINPEFGSLNLAQAVILLAYECSRRALAQPTAKEIEPLAPHGDLEGLMGQLNAELEAKGYFHPPSRTQSTKNTLRTIFTKTGWSSREVKAVRGIIRALVDPARTAGLTAKKANSKKTCSDHPSGVCYVAYRRVSTFLGCCRTAIRLWQCPRGPGTCQARQGKEDLQDRRFRSGLAHGQAHLQDAGRVGSAGCPWKWPLGFQYLRRQDGSATKDLQRAAVRLKT